MDQSKEEIIKYLEFIRQKKLCAYMSEICDCKYGFSHHNRNDLGKRILHEQTGCPEMRDVIGLLQMIPPEVFVEAKKTLHRKTIEFFAKVNKEWPEKGEKV